MPRKQKNPKPKKEQHEEENTIKEVQGQVMIPTTKTVKVPMKITDIPKSTLSTEEAMEYLNKGIVTQQQAADVLSMNDTMEEIEKVEEERKKMDKEMGDVVDEIEVIRREPERISMADEFERLTRKPSIDSVFTQKRMAQDAYRSSVQQHMADIRMFMSDMNRVKGYVKDELARDWIGDRLKMWDMKLSELRLPDATG